MPLDTSPPDGLEVERVAIAMAAANGLSWVVMEAEARQAYRRSANGALVLLAIKPPSPRHLPTILTDISAALRRAAIALDYAEASEATVKDLHRQAARADLISRILGLSLEPEEEAV